MEAHVRLLETKLFARRDEDLLADEIEIRDLLGHRVLDLHARVHFHEIVVQVFVDEELDRAETFIIRSARDFASRGPHAGSDLGAHDGREGFFDDLLVAALERALALAQMDHVAVAVGQDLDLDVTRAFDVLLDEDVRRPEGRLRLASRRVERLLELGFGAHDAHTPTAAAVRSLEQHGVTDTGRGLLGLADVLEHAGARQ